MKLRPLRQRALSALITGIVLIAGCAMGQQNPSSPVPSNIESAANNAQPPHGSGDSPIVQVNSDPNISLSALATLIRNEVNIIRDRHDLKPLSHNGRLDPIALAHSVDMAAGDFFDHVNGDGDGPTERGMKVGFECKIQIGNAVATGLAENLFLTHTYRTVSRTTYSDRVEETYDFKTVEFMAEEIVTGWYHSPPHRKNLLDTRSQSQGIGIYITDDRKVYVTQNLC